MSCLEAWLARTLGTSGPYHIHLLDVSGNKKLAQNMMRARVAAQGMTILSMFTATYFIATKPAEAHAEAAR